ncbi:hypothetical protein [Geodermatophilus sp. URMC 63]
MVPSAGPGSGDPIDRVTAAGVTVAVPVSGAGEPDGPPPPPPGEQARDTEGEHSRGDRPAGLLAEADQRGDAYAQQDQPTTAAATAAVVISGRRSTAAGAPHGSGNGVRHALLPPQILREHCTPPVIAEPRRHPGRTV